MDYFKINGRVYDVLVLSVDEDFSILQSENAGRSIAPGAPMVLDPLGTFYNHKVVFGRREGYEAEYDALYAYLSKPRNGGIPVELPHNQTTIAYNAYVSIGARGLKRIDKNLGKTYWDKFEVNFIAMEAQVKPE